MCAKTDINNWFENVLTKVYDSHNSRITEGHKYEDLRQLDDGKWHSLTEGCEMYVISRKNDVLVICTMRKGTVIPIHHHPDFKERFFVEKGEVKEDLTNKVFNSQNPECSFYAFEPHQYRALEDTELKIFCEPLN